MDRWANDRVGMSEIPLFNTVGKLEARCPAWSLISQRDTSAMAAAANNNTDPVGDELAALAAIYGSDYEALPPKAASAFQPLFRLRLTPVTGGSDVDNRVTCTLTVQLPKRYPKSSIVPTVTIESATLDKAQLSALTGTANRAMAELIKERRPLIFDMAGVVHEQLCAINDGIPRMSAFDSMLERQAGVAAAKLRADAAALDDARAAEQREAEQLRDRVAAELQKRKPSPTDGLALADAVARALPLPDLGGSADDTSSGSPPALNTSISRFKADFFVLGELGKGGFGRVWRVRNKVDGLLYAVKKIPMLRHDSNANRRLLREVTTLSRLTHRHIVRYYNAWIEDDDGDGDDDDGSTSSGEEEYSEGDSGEGSSNTPTLSPLVGPPATAAPAIIVGDFGAPVRDSAAEVAVAVVGVVREPVAPPGGDASAHSEPFVFGWQRDVTATVPVLDVIHRDNEDGGGGGGEKLVDGDSICVSDSDSDGADGDENEGEEDDEDGQPGALGAHNEVSDWMGLETSRASLLNTTATRRRQRRRQHASSLPPASGYTASSSSSSSSEDTDYDDDDDDDDDDNTGTSARLLAAADTTTHDSALLAQFQGAGLILDNLLGDGAPTATDAAFRKRRPPAPGPTAHALAATTAGAVAIFHPSPSLTSTSLFESPSVLPGGGGLGGVPFPPSPLAAHQHHRGGGGGGGGGGRGAAPTLGRRRALFIQMEHCSTTLRSLIDTSGGEGAALPLTVRWRILRQLVEALHFLHSRGVMHRDIKPANILIDAESNIKVREWRSGVGEGVEKWGGRGGDWRKGSVQASECVHACINKKNSVDCVLAVFLLKLIHKKFALTLLPPSHVAGRLWPGYGAAQQRDKRPSALHCRRGGGRSAAPSPWASARARGRGGCGPGPPPRSC